MYLIFVHDAQVSMTLLTSPLFSPSELELPLVANDKLWHARTAAEWKTILENHPTTTSPRITLSDCVRSALNSGTLPDVVDPPNSLCYVLYGLWGTILEYRQTHHMLRGGDAFFQSDGLSLAARFDALSKVLNALRATASRIPEAPEGPLFHGKLAQMRSILEFDTLALNAPIQALPLFAGKEGELEAQRVFSHLQEWSQSREARQSLWHAGQIYKGAADCEGRALTGFEAVTLYQASLVFWVYGIIIGGRNQRRGIRVEDGADAFGSVVELDGDLSQKVKQFFAHGEGRPGLANVVGHDPGHFYSVHKPVAMMNVGIGILHHRANAPTDGKGGRGLGTSGGGKGRSFVHGLIKLMIELSRAAEIVGFG